jgi:hypothetical protein
MIHVIEHKVVVPEYRVVCALHLLCAFSSLSSFLILVLRSSHSHSHSHVNVSILLYQDTRTNSRTTTFNGLHISGQVHLLNLHWIEMTCVAPVALVLFPFVLVVVGNLLGTCFVVVSLTYRPMMESRIDFVI